MAIADQDQEAFTLCLNMLRPPADDECRLRQLTNAYELGRQRGLTRACEILEADTAALIASEP